MSKQLLQEFLRKSATHSFLHVCLLMLCCHFSVSLCFHSDEGLLQHFCTQYRLYPQSRHVLPHNNNIHNRLQNAFLHNIFLSQNTHTSYLRANICGVYQRIFVVFTNTNQEGTFALTFKEKITITEKEILFSFLFLCYNRSIVCFGCDAVVLNAIEKRSTRSHTYYRTIIQIHVCTIVGRSPKTNLTCSPLSFELFNKNCIYRGTIICGSFYIISYTNIQI